jgi:lipopolysaccharide biosynthesis glycosyltransferase
MAIDAKKWIYSDMSDIIPVFVGYDPREAIAFHTCVNSIIRHATQPVAIHPVALNLFKDYSETHTDGSNHFIYTRFLVPYLMHWTGWAIFIDGDMIVRDDITALWNLREPDKDVMVVKHDYKTRMPVKYLGAKNEDYPRKNWSSVILWNCSSFPNRRLTPEFVQGSTGSFLHRFSWLDDQRIGQLPPEWNWLPDEYGVNTNAKLLHYTLGTPCFHEFADTPQAEEWHRERLFTEYCQQRIDL